MNKEAAIIEAILFLESDSVDIAFLVKASQLSKEVVLETIKYLQNKYDSEDSGIELLEIGGGYLLSPKSSLWNFLKERYGKKNDNKLSRAAIETLSIIAYSQPITKGEIENIRGVSADGMIRLLLAKDFIKEVGKKEIPGKPVLFGTTKTFLKTFKLKSISDLPKLTEVEKEKFELN